MIPLGVTLSGRSKLGAPERTSYEELLGSVGMFSFNKPGTILSYTVDAADKNGNGLYVIQLETGQR